MDKDWVITIGRQFGSGGREVGELLSKQLNIPFYDNDLISMAADKGGLSKKVIENIDEKAGSFLYSLSIATTPFGGRVSPVYEMPINDKLFLLQSEVIKDVVQKGPCLIVGRCADYVLRDKSNVLKVFIHSDIENRIKRKTLLNKDMPLDKLKDMILKTDKKRASYYNYYTAKKWGSIDSYNMSVDSGILGVKGCVEVIKKAIECL